MARRRKRLGKFLTWFRDSVPPPHKPSRGTHGRLHHAGRKIESPVTGRPVFAARERDGHITTRGRRVLGREQFALPPGPEEKRRGIKGRLPIDTLKRARNALARAAQMRRRDDLTAGQLTAIQHRVNRAFPEIHVEPIEGPRPRAHATMRRGMTKADVIREFNELYPPETFRRYGGAIDRPMRNEAWNNYTDALAKDRRITMKQYETWSSPWKD